MHFIHLLFLSDEIVLFREEKLNFKQLLLDFKLDPFTVNYHTL
jgi:hypothetical protein